MKRTRSGHVYGDTAAKRARQCRRFPFLWMLPEMRGEVISNVSDVADRAALARTCQEMHQRISPTLPKLPKYWLFAWESLKQHGTREQIQAGRTAFHELIIDMALPTWSGVFYYGNIHYRSFYRCNHLFWQWRDDRADQYFNLLFDVDSRKWTVCPVNFYPERFTLYDVTRLALLNAHVLATWRDFVQRTRIKPGHYHEDGRFDF